MSSPLKIRHHVPRIYARELVRGSIVEAKGKLFLILDTQRTGENRIKLWWRPLGQSGEVDRAMLPVTVEPSLWYLDATPVIEEEPL